MVLQLLFSFFQNPELHSFFFQAAYLTTLLPPHLFTMLPPGFDPQQPGRTLDSDNSLVKSSLYLFLFPSQSENHFLPKL